MSGKIFFSIDTAVDRKVLRGTIFHENRQSEDVSDKNMLFLAYAV